MSDITRPDRDLSKAHPLLQERWPLVRARLAGLGFAVIVEEVYRPDARQAWLYGQGRTPEQLMAKGLDPTLARAGAVVTNAWSAKTSAHGYVLPLCTEDFPEGVPAACALDVVPLGDDGAPWTADDPWDAFVSAMVGIGAECGLVHFHAPGKAVWDRPHLQLAQWNDATHTLRTP